MRKINIEITKARLEGFSCSFDDEGKVQLTGNLGLLTDGGKRISSYSVSTESYVTNKFELPIKVIEPIQSIARELEVIVTRHCRDSQLVLSAPKDENDF